MGWRFAREPEVWAKIVECRKAIQASIALRKKIIDEYYPWAVGQVRSLCKRRGMPFDEVEGSATDGLLRAIRRFDPTTNVPFEVFARQHIDGATLDRARKNEPRPCRHGAKPRFELRSLNTVGEADLGNTPNYPSNQIFKETLKKLLKKISTPLRKNLFVRVALLREDVSVAAEAVGADPDYTDVECRAAFREAADAAIEINLAGEEFLGADTAYDKKPTKKHSRRLLRDAELLKLALAALKETRQAETYPDPQARPLVGVCVECERHVVGPRGVKGPIPHRCLCGASVEVS